MNDILEYYSEELEEITDKYSVERIGDIVVSEKSGKKLLCYLLLIDNENLKEVVEKRILDEITLHNERKPSIFLYLIRGIRNNDCRSESINTLLILLEKTGKKLDVCPVVYGILKIHIKKVQKYFEMVEGFSICHGGGDPDEIFENGGTCPV